MKTRRAPPPPPLLLPEEVIVEILSWLPVRSLLRFRCVSKSLKTLISDPNFVKLHLQRSPKNASVLLTLRSHGSNYALPCSVPPLMENPSSYTLTPNHTYQLKARFRVCGSVNGLVCLCSYSQREYVADEYWVHFWNPATRLRSRASPSILVGYSIHGALVTFGFGYVSSADTYKVVALLFTHETMEIELRVHIMGGGDTCWRKISSFPPFPLIDRGDGKFVSGTLNWLALRKSGLGYDWDEVTVNELSIFSVDVGKETYEHLLMPEGLDQVPCQETYLNLAVLRGCLCLCHDYKRTHFVVWQMTEFGVRESWSQLVNVSYHHLRVSACFLLPVCISENGDDVLISNCYNLEEIVYNRRDNRVQRSKTTNFWKNWNDYVQSLVPC